MDKQKTDGLIMDKRINRGYKRLYLILTCNIHFFSNPNDKTPIGGQGASIGNNHEVTPWGHWITIIEK